MITLISNLSLIIMIISMGVAVLHPRLNLPCYIDVLIWIFIIGATAMLVTSNLSEHSLGGEVLLRFAGSLLVAATVADRFRRERKKNELRQSF